MKDIDVCPSPELLHLYDLEDKIVVVTDILRATSCMVTGFAHGVAQMIPVQEVEECRKIQKLGYLAAAERDGSKVEGFDLDNSPFSYMNEKVKGRIIAVTTTNGTQAIKLSEHAFQVVIGAFLNKRAVVEHLKAMQKDVLIVCAGWKGKVNLEDSLFAGAIVEALKDTFTVENDFALMTQMLYSQYQPNLLAIVSQCSHVQRLKKLGIEDDIEFCLIENKYNVVPILKEGALSLTHNI
jgi:2-phosphosulfolactate phosphatase